MSVSKCSMKLTCLISAVWLWQASALMAQAFPFTAHVEKTHIQAGETITLTLEFAGKAKNEPDLIVLERDFTIVSRQTSTESTFIDGNFRAKTSWILELLPKNSAAKLVIPAIKFDKHSSSPIDIVQSGEKVSSTTKGIELNVATDTDSVYVNAELVLNIEIKTSLSLRNGTLSKPDIRDAIVEPLLEDGQSEVIEGGIKYQVFKRSYAIFPAKAGELTIPPLVFEGTVAKARASTRAFSGFFSTGAQVSARSRDIKIKVKDVPADFPKGQPFLPLKSFLVIESFDEPDPKFEVNKATTRRFELKAKGTLTSFLPTISPPTVENLQIYSESGHKVQKSVPDGIEASIKFSHVYMPTAGGKLRVPEQTIYWWDTDNDKLKTTVIRALELDVTGMAQAIADIKPPEVNEQPQAIPTEPTPNSGNNRVWQMLAALFLGLWILTIIGFLVMRKLAKRKSTSKIASPQSRELADLVKDIMTACDANDGKRAYRSLHAFRAWAEKTNNTDLLLKDFGERIGLLESALFNQQKDVDVRAILASIKRSASTMKLSKVSEPTLAPLYPV